MKIAIIRLMAFVTVMMLASAGARADLASSPTSNPLFLIGAVAVLVVVLWLLIRGALSMSRNPDDSDDSAGVGALEGIDEDDDERRKK